jgi:diketogulonate reductase-like aldo/keto reductase
MTEPLKVGGVTVPALMYGTAWKEERTRPLTAAALAAGFRAVDTANQRKHYFEAAVGEAIAASGIARSDLFLQSKFTSLGGQDQRLPYDPDADVATQVRQSLQSSLEHLGVTWLDSYLLHGPSLRHGWSAEDREALETMAALQAEGRVRLVGVSNVTREQLETLCRDFPAPAFVQNRCYARTGWDAQVRAVCRERGIVYQGFSLLTANQRELATPAVATIARRLGATVPQVVFAFARAVGMLPLTGTSSPEHLRQDLASVALSLEPREIRALEEVAAA